MLMLMPMPMPMPMLGLIPVLGRLEGLPAVALHSSG